jgi:c-di-AMP phosphodiesterase-like protein
LPGKIEDPLLKGFFDDKFRSPYLSNRIYSSVKKIVNENEGNDENIKIKISDDNYRVEVITDATYNTITDGRRLASFSKDIPQKGYGPKLSYLKYVLN